MSNIAAHWQPFGSRQLAEHGTGRTQRTASPGLLPRCLHHVVAVAWARPVLANLTTPTWCISSHILLNFLTSHPTRTLGRSS